MTFSGRFALTAVATAVLTSAIPSAWALGLGRIQVQSALGESLRAEIDVTSLSPEEAANLRVRVASPDSYRAAGVDYNAVLPGTQVELLRRADGRPYLKLISDRGVSEPFVDVILEINWSTGRLVREYTMLFDPPATARTSTPPAQTAAPVMSAGGAAASGTVASRGERRPVPARTGGEAVPSSAPDPRSGSGAAAAGNVDEYKVRAGDSLSKIASRTQRAGVSLDQMLVSLYRGNPQAFVENNMNRLKSGVVLAVPSAESVNGVSAAEARQVIQAQSADFGAYRQRLAGSVPVAKATGSARQASGNVQATVEDRKPGAASTPDKLTLSKGSSGKSSAAEDQISKDRAKKADDVRVAELSKNVDELKRLSGAAASAVVAPKPAAPAASVASAVAAKVVAPNVPGPASAVTPPRVPSAAPAIVAAAPLPPSAPIAAMSPSRVASVAAMPVVPASAPLAAAAPASASASASVPLPTVAKATASASPVPKTPPRVPAKPSTDEPSMISSLLDDNPLAVWLGGGALALLAGFGIFKFSQRKKKDSGETSFLESRLQPDSFFGASGGQRIDTRDAGGNSSSMSYSLSQLDAIGDVDPVAEADVYLAYGRDLQAEEILKEAMRSNPDRMAIRTKLLEVYAKRRDTKGFELLANQLFALTRGEGEDWAKARELGRQIDPENPLFKPGGTPASTIHGDGGEFVEPLGASTMPQSVLPSPSHFSGVIAKAPSPSSLDKGIDLDLDLGDPETGTPTAPSELDAMHSSKSTPYRIEDSQAMSLDFSVPEVPLLQPKLPRLSEPSAFDMSDVSFDLDMPDQSLMNPPVKAVAADTGFGGIDVPSFDEAGEDDPLSRKLELAEEFRQIGDNDGARDLLHEVIAKSAGPVKSRAQSMLADLG